MRRAYLTTGTTGDQRVLYVMTATLEESMTIAQRMRLIGANGLPALHAYEDGCRLVSNYDVSLLTRSGALAVLADARRVLGLVVPRWR